MLTGTELLEEVFGEEILEGLPDLRELEEVDGVTNWSVDFSYNSGWYNYYTVSFNYDGKKYEFEYQDHTSDNVCDSEVDDASFKEVVDNSAKITVTEGSPSFINDARFVLTFPTYHTIDFDKVNTLDDIKLVLSCLSPAIRSDNENFNKVKHLLSDN